MDGLVAVIDKKKCTMCGNCLANCPTGAIVNTLPKKPEPEKDIA